MRGGGAGVRRAIGVEFSCFSEGVEVLAAAAVDLCRWREGDDVDVVPLPGLLIIKLWERTEVAR